ncbi:MAG: hypothetical protein SGJ04_00290 [Bacteroidota bacterium]|nr:hypothetical protein [Bacteroidota bacterium]
MLNKHQIGYTIYIIILLLQAKLGVSQRYEKDKNPPIGGVVIRALFPSSAFETAPSSINKNGNIISVVGTGGFSWGGLVRKNVSQNGLFYLESGLNYTRRNYENRYSDSTGEINVTVPLRVDNYELPVIGGVMVKFNQNYYLSSGLGFSFDFFPQSLRKNGDSLSIISNRRNWVIAGLEARIGLEYRTNGKGIIYLGAAYHRMATNVANNRYQYTRVDGQKVETGLPLQAHYFSIDLRYFFTNYRTEPVNYNSLP